MGQTHHRPSLSLFIPRIFFVLHPVKSLSGALFLSFFHFLVGGICWKVVGPQWWVSGIKETAKLRPGSVCNQDNLGPSFGSISYRQSQPDPHPIPKSSCNPILNNHKTLKKPPPPQWGAQTGLGPSSVPLASN